MIEVEVKIPIENIEKIKQKNYLVCIGQP